MSLKALSMIALALTLTSCSCKPEYIEVPVEVKVPVKCKVELPDGEINQSLNDSEKYLEVLKYISNLHQNIKRCE